MPSARARYSAIDRTVDERDQPARWHQLEVTIGGDAPGLGRHARGEHARTARDARLPVLGDAARTDATRSSTRLGAHVVDTVAGEEDIDTVAIGQRRPRHEQA